MPNISSYCREENCESAPIVISSNKAEPINHQFRASTMNEETDALISQTAGIELKELNRDVEDCPEERVQANFHFIRICAQGNVKKVKKLLESKTIDFNATDSDGQTGLFWACKQGHFKVVKILLEKCQSLDLNKAEKSGMTPLDTACFHKQAKISQLLLTHLDQSKTCFIWACAQGRFQKVKTLLKSKSIDFNATDDDGRTGFYHACRHGHFQVVKMLVEQSQGLELDLNKADKGGMTPFHTACFNQQAKVVYFLMESEDKYGIDLSLVDQNGFTGFGYLTKKCDLKSETESPPHPNLTQDIEGGFPSCMRNLF